MILYYPDSRVLYVFSVRVVQVWDNLPNEVVLATSVSVFKIPLKFKSCVLFLMLCFSVVLSMFYGQL